MVRELKGSPRGWSCAVACLSLCTGRNQYHWCLQCYADIKGEDIQVGHGTLVTDLPGHSPELLEESTLAPHLPAFHP